MTAIASAEVLTMIVALTAAFGLLIGSFLNVVIYRVPIGKSVVAPASSCPGCESPIRVIDNIPVLSWLALRGKCRNCAEPISARYPLVELATGALLVVTALRFGPAVIEAPTTTATIAALIVLVAFLYVAAVAVALAAIDLDTHTLPNVIVLPAYIVGGLLLLTAAVLSGDFEPFFRALLGAGILFVAYLIMAIAYPGGMGLGDVKLAGVLGLYLGWLGWGSLAVGAFAAFLFGGLFSVALVVSRRATRKSGIPFGPWMLLGAFVSFFIGEPAWAGYLSLVGIA